MSFTDDYDYELPKERIAQFPLASRVDARLLVVDRRARTLDCAYIRDLPELLAPGDLLVLNNTRVIPARLVGHRTRTGGRWQGLFLAAADAGLWRILGKTRGRLEPGETITLHDRSGRPSVELHLVSRLEGGEWIARPAAGESVLEILERVGRVPLPGYIRGGEMIDSDPVQYQTVYAEQPGAVAAPTAGLHFTNELLRRLRQRGLETGSVTLHVGLGTFRPITAERLEDHRMHAEWACLPAATVEQIRACRARGGRVIAVGTTVVRTLESAAAAADPLQPWEGETRLFIRPPYQFRAIDALMTNFHLPRSTLLVLVRTFGGDQLIRDAYQLAIDEEFRFYSYGDAMLIL